MFRSYRAPRAWLTALSLCGATLCETGRARGDTETIHVEYTADAACPSSQTFIARVLRSTPNVQLSDSRQGVRTFAVSIQRNRVAFVGKLVVSEGATSTVARSVTGEKCEPIAKALALSTVLAIDPTAAPQLEDEPPLDDENTSRNAPARGTDPSTAPSSSNVEAGPSREGSPETGLSREGLSREGLPTGSRPKALSPGTAPTDLPKAQSHREDSSEAPTSARPRGLGLFLGPSARTGIAPGLTYGGTLSLEAQSAGPLSAFGAEVAYSQANSDSTSGARSSLQYLLAAPMGCGPSLELGRAARIAPCLSAELGVVGGKGEGLPLPRSDQRWWSAIKAPVHFSAPLGNSVWIRAEAGPTFAITRYHFVFTDPQVSVYRVPAVAFFAALKLGFRL